MEDLRRVLMIILQSVSLPMDVTGVPICPLNAIWLGELNQRMTLPQLGHLFLVCPLGNTVALCAGTVVDSNHYLFLTRPSEAQLYVLENLRPNDSDSALLVLLLSPGFIEDMAKFLGIPADLGYLLHAIPLPHGDTLSRLLQLLASTLQATPDRDEAEELFMEVVGQVLRLLRLRHDAMASLTGHKKNTVHDLLPRLLQARQFIEARYLEPIKTQSVAQHVALSEYHFARLFKTAFDITVHQYVVRLRLDKARHLLEASEMRVTDIALTIGYKSLSAFIHAFRRHFGMTPSAYQSLFKN